MTELTYEDIIKAYAELQKKYKLPKYEDLDRHFLATQGLLYYYRKPVEPYLMYALLKIAYDKLSSLNSVLFEILYNMNPDIINHETKEAVRDVKDDIIKESIAISALTRKALVLFYDTNDKDKADMLNELFDHYLAKREWFTGILKLTIERLKKFDLSNTKKEKEDNRYYG